MKTDKYAELCRVRALSGMLQTKAEAENPPFSIIKCRRTLVFQRRKSLPIFSYHTLSAKSRDGGYDAGQIGFSAAKTIVKRQLPLPHKGAEVLRTARYAAARKTVNNAIIGS